MNRRIKHFLCCLLFALFAASVSAGQAPAVQQISITAKRFSYQPGEITVQKGQLVVLELTSEDVTHGLKCKELGFHATIHKGETVEVKFTPLQAGHFVARCSHFCGMGHGSMTVAIDVVDK